MIEKRSEQLHLRKLHISEITDDMLEWFLDDALMQYYTNSKITITKERLIQSITQGEETGTSYTFGIFDNASERCIGTMKLGPINKIHRISDLVVLIGNKDFHGKGLAIDAIKLGIRIAFEDFDLRKLYGGMYASNHASIKAYLRAGWVMEGILTGHYYNRGRNEDRLEVGCFNPKYFTLDEINNAVLLKLDEVLLKYS